LEGDVEGLLEGEVDGDIVGTLVVGDFVGPIGIVGEFVPHGSVMVTSSRNATYLTCWVKSYLIASASSKGPGHSAQVSFAIKKFDSVFAITPIVRLSSTVFRNQVSGIPSMVSFTLTIARHSGETVETKFHGDPGLVEVQEMMNPGGTGSEKSPTRTANVAVVDGSVNMTNFALV